MLICRGQLVIRNPSNQEIADCLGFNEPVDQTQVPDLVVIGAGPSGLAGRYDIAKRKATTLLLLEAQGCAWWSGWFKLKIKITWDFPPVSPVRSWQLGRISRHRSSVHICSLQKPYDLSATVNRTKVIELENGARISTRTVMIATGAQYRKLPLENLSRFEGAGVYHGATFVEAQLCAGEEVIVVGGGNSAGQAGCIFGTDCKACAHVSQVNRLGY